MRFRLLCAMATRLPSTSEATDSTTSICCHSGARPLKPSTSSRMVIANAANSGAPPIISVTGVGAPW